MTQDCDTALELNERHSTSSTMNRTDHSNEQEELINLSSNRILNSNSPSNLNANERQSQQSQQSQQFMIQSNPNNPNYKNFSNPQYIHNNQNYNLINQSNMNNQNNNQNINNQIINNQIINTQNINHNYPNVDLKKLHAYLHYLESPHRVQLAPNFVLNDAEKEFLDICLKKLCMNTIVQDFGGVIQYNPNSDQYTVEIPSRQQKKSS